MNKQFRSLMTALALAVPVMSAQAALIDFTFSGVADFAIGEQTFDAAAFTVRATADTANLFQTFPPLQEQDVFQYGNLVGTLSIDGLGDGVFTKNIGFFSNPIEQVAGLMARVEFIPFSQVFQLADVIGLKSPELASYDMKSEITLDNAQLYDPQQWFEIATSFGKLTATGFSSVKMQVLSSPVPESSTAWLFALGLPVLIGACARRSQR